METDITLYGEAKTLRTSSLTPVETEDAAGLFPQDKAHLKIASGRDYEYSTCSNEFEIWQASPSMLVYLKNRPRASGFSQIYPADYEPYRFDALPWLVRKARDSVQSLKVKQIDRLAKEGGSVLDLGCGGGKLLTLLAEHSRRNFDLWGIDLSASPGIEIARAKGVRFFIGPVEDFQPERKFDLIILNQVIEHFADVRGLLAHCRRLLNEGGLLFIETPNTDSLDFRLFRSRYWGGYHIPRHFYIFNHANVEQILNECEFQVTEQESLASPAFWIQSLHHWFEDRNARMIIRLFSIRNPILLVLFTFLDVFIIKCLNGKTSNMRVIAKKSSTNSSSRPS